MGMRLRPGLQLLQRRDQLVGRAGVFGRRRVGVVFARAREIAIWISMAAIGARIIIRQRAQAAAADRRHRAGSRRRTSPCAPSDA